jgi:hypothetical protein
MAEPTVNQISAYIRLMEQKINSFAAQLSAVKIQAAVPASLPGQYAGKPIPSTLGVEVTVPAGSMAAVRGNIRIEPDGPFQARAIHFAARYASGAAIDWVPTASTDSAGIDFYWEYMISGSRRNRQNIPVPSSLTWRAEVGNGYWDFIVPDTFPAASTVTVTITPCRVLSAEIDKTIYIAFSGAYLMVG